MLTQGQRAPNFELRGTNGDDFDDYELSQFTDRNCVLLAFYVFDFAPVCTQEMCSLRDAESFVFTNDMAVFGLSTDGIYSHKKFAQEYDIDFPLLADTDGSVAEAFDIRYRAEGCSGVAQRSMFIIDSQQVIQYAWTTEDPWDEPDYDSIRHAAANLR